MELKPNMIENSKWSFQFSRKAIFTFLAITLFYFFEASQMSYFNVLAPYYLAQGYHENQVAGLSSAYYYGNVIGLLPVGYALDHFPLRKILLWAIIGSVISALLLAMGHSYSTDLIARFLCGFFGGTFSFIGGIRVILSLFPNRFSFFMGFFISSGMFAGLVCQYPLLRVVNHIGIQGTMIVMVVFGLIVTIFNLLYLHPPTTHIQENKENKYPGTVRQMCFEIVTNLRNWLDCIMIVLLDTPISIMGTLWGIVLMTGFYGFSDGTSAVMVMCLFAGLMLGSMFWGIFSDRYNNSGGIIILGAAASLAILILMLVSQHHANPIIIAVLSFGLGLFSSCQSLGFTWLTKNMRPELIGRNSAFNSMILMGSGGGFKQFGAVLLASSPFFRGMPSVVNLIVCMAIAMTLVLIYVAVRKKVFKNLVF